MQQCCETSLTNCLTAWFHLPMILHPGNLEDLNNVQSGVYGAKSQIQINQMNMFRASRPSSAVRVQKDKPLQGIPPK